MARIALPARWQQQFEKTLFAKLLASESVAKLVALGRAEVDRPITAMRENGDAALADGLQHLLTGHRGELVFAVHCDIAKLVQALAAREVPRFHGSLTLVGDGVSDLAPLAAALTALTEATEATSLRDLTIADRPFRAGTARDGITVTMPALIDGSLVMLFGTDLEQHGARLLATEDRLAGDTDSPFWLRGDLRAAGPALAQQLADRAKEEGLPFDGAKLAQDLGITAPQAMTLWVRPDGEHMQIEAALDLAAGDHGVFDLMPVDADAPRLLRYLPAGSDAFSTAPISLTKAYELTNLVFAAMGDDAPMPFDAAMAAFADATKVRLKEDLLDHLGTGLMIVQEIDDQTDLDAIEESIDDNPLGAALSGCYAMSLRNGKAFGESLEKLLRARGLHATRKSEDYQDVKIHRLRLAGLIQLEYVVLDDMLLVATGVTEAQGALLRGIVDARKNGDGSLPKAAKAHVEALPQGWTGLSVSPMGRVLRNLGTTLITLEQRGGEIEDLPAEGAAILRAVSTLGADLERVGLGSMAASMHKEPRRLAFRWHW